jgi:CRP/FNR family transcriptional regulator, anaerobic regulatory protein
MAQPGGPAEKDGILEKFAFFRQASPALQTQIAAAAVLGHIPANAYFYREGDPCESFALVGSGNIRVFKEGNTGRQITLYHVQDGQACLVNMLCVLLDRPAMASAQTEAATDAVVLPAAAVRGWIANHEAMRNFVFETMAVRVVEVMTLVEEICFHKTDNRLATYLLRRFANDGDPQRAFSATHEELATELGTAREVISRLLKMFERHGAVEIARGRIRLRDDAVLRSLTGLR